MSDYTEASVPTQAGKTIFITGANTGIGFEAARVLAGRGARVLLGCRSEEKANVAMGKIREQHPDADLVWIPLDLTSLKSVAVAADEVKKEPRLDVLVNNAGVMIPPKTLTEDGFELQFGVNHLGHFALTGHLLDLLAATPGARVVNVSSGAHRDGRIDFDDPHAEHSYKPMNRYQMSKAANLYFTLELARRCKARGLDVTSLACHPQYTGGRRAPDTPRRDVARRDADGVLRPGQANGDGPLGGTREDRGAHPRRSGRPEAVGPERGADGCLVPGRLSPNLPMRRTGPTSCRLVGCGSPGSASGRRRGRTTWRRPRKSSRPFAPRRGPG
jgi:NAD(P)-dependent dehydrogenase (short-subunit alcohol dehydrogenase family)